MAHSLECDVKYAPRIVIAFIKLTVLRKIEKIWQPGTQEA